MTHDNRYEYLDGQKQRVQEARAAGQGQDPELAFDKTIRARIGSFNVSEQLNWIYRNDIEACWEKYVEEREKKTTDEKTIQPVAGKGEDRIEASEIDDLNKSATVTAASG